MKALGVEEGEEVKPCRRCYTPKPLSMYPFERRNRDGRAGTCRACVSDKQAKSETYKKYQSDYYRENRERLASDRKTYRANNAASISEKKRRYRQENPDVVAAANADYYRKNKSKLNVYKSDYYRRNADRLKARAKRYYEENKAEVFRYYRERARLDPVFRQKKALRGLLRKFLLRSGQSKAGTTSETLGYSVDSLMKRLAFQFKPGMGWHNYGDWHIDHKIPISRFLRRGETRPAIVNALSNLQPLWAAENLAKRDSLPEPLLRRKSA